MTSEALHKRILEEKLLLDLDITCLLIGSSSGRRRFDQLYVVQRVDYQSRGHIPRVLKVREL